MMTTVPLQAYKIVCLSLAFHVSSVETTLACDFEEASICGYTQDTTDDFDWTRSSGPTSSWETGPDTDHTFASSVGNYMYIEATPQNDHEVARLVSSVYTPSARAECIYFWCHMHGQDIGKLRIYFQRSGQRGSTVFSVQGNQGDTWLLGELNIPENSQPFQLVFEGSGGSDYRGDIGLDDINVTARHCNVIPAGPLSAVIFPNSSQYSTQENSEMPNISCTCRGCVPECDVVWSFGRTTMRNSSNLWLGTVSRFSSGKYICACINPATFITEAISFTLDVKYGPDTVILLPDTNIYTVDEGSSIPRIACSCGLCNPNCSAEWMFNSSLFEANSILHFDDVTRNASGQYSCLCINTETLDNKSRHIDVMVTYGPDEIILSPNNSKYSVEERKAAPNIKCSCGSCVPTCEVLWLYNGTVIGNSFELQLANISRIHTGNYTCRCSNPSTGDEKIELVDISVVYGPDEAIISPYNPKHSVVEGEIAPVINCSCGSCVPTCNVVWVYNGLVIWKGSELQLGYIYRNQTGNYTCQCSNPSIGVEKTRHVELSIAYGPDAAIISPYDHKHFVVEGDTAPDINCSCGACVPTCNVVWVYNGTEIWKGAELQLGYIYRNQTGNYTCQCSNPSIGVERTRHVELSIAYGPAELKFSPDLTGHSGATGSYFGNITCTCGECQPRCIVKWIKDKLYTTYSSTLEFEQLSVSDTGLYLCYCINQYTTYTVTKEFQLQVNALPAQPCQKETDEWGTFWKETLAGERLTLDCKKEGYTGSVSRQCSTDGKWKLPLYECIRPSIAKVQEKLDMLTENISSAGLSSVLDELVNITSISEEEDSDLFSGELEEVTKYLDVVARLADSDLPPSEEQSRAFLNTASNLLNEKNKRSWSTLSQSKGDSGAAKLLQSIDTLSGALTKGLEETNTSKVTIIQSNIFLEASKVNASQQEIKFPLPSPSPDVKPINGTKFSLPLGNNSETTPKKYTMALYKTLAGILPNTMYSTQSNKTDDQYELNTRVLSLQVFPKQKILFKPLEITFDLQNLNFHNAICSYWNFQEKRWDSDGCQVKRFVKSSVICECEHLTNFAVLMSPWQEPSAESTVIEIISIVGCSISIFCLIATTALHILLWRNLKNDRAVILINICASLTATYIIFLAGINQTANQEACTAVAALLHYILLVVFCLMLAEGIEIVITVKYVFIRKSRIKWMIPLAWGVPAVIVGISLGATRLNGYGTKNFCWLSVENGVIWAFVGPAMLIIAVNIVFLGILLRTMLKTKAYGDMSEVDRIKASTRCLCVLVPLMGCTWVLGIFYVNDRTTWIQYIFAICNSLQGFFIFLFHGVLNKQLQTALKSRQKKFKDSHSLSKHSHSVSKSSSTKRTEVTGVVNPVFNISLSPDSDAESTQVPDNNRKKSFSSDEVVHSLPTRIINIGWKMWPFYRSGSYSPMQDNSLQITGSNDI